MNIRNAIVYLFCVISCVTSAQNDTIPFVGKGIDTSLLKIDSKNNWNFKGVKCEGHKAIYYTTGFYSGRLDRVLWFSNGKLDSVVIYSFGFFPLTINKLSVLSKVKIDIQKKTRYYLLYSADNILQAYYTYKIINKIPLSVSKICSLDQEIRFVDDGCQYNYYSNGQIKDVGHYQMGNKDGYWRYYDEAGNLLKEERYKNNLLIK